MYSVLANSIKINLILLSLFDLEKRGKGYPKFTNNSNVTFYP